MKCNNDILTRKINRQDVFFEKGHDINNSLFALSKVKNIIDEVITTQKITLQEVTEIYYVIFEIDVDIVSSFFPFRIFFDILESNYPDNTEILHFLLLLTAHSALGNYFNPNVIINENDVSFLIELLKSLQYKSSSLNLIACICYKNQNFIQVFCEKGILDILSDIDLDHPISNFLAFLSQSTLIEHQSKKLAIFIKPLIFSSNNQLVLNGLIILCNLIKSPFEHISNMLIEEYSCILINKFKEFLNLAHDEIIITLLNIFCSIPNLAKEMIDLLFCLVSFKNHENINRFLNYSSLIFRDQYHFWKNEIDLNLLFETLLPYVNNEDIPFQTEASIFLTLMRYGGYTQLCQPIMIHLLLKFMLYPNFSILCLNAISKLLALSESPKSLLGDQMEEAFEAFNELANSENEDISTKSVLLLERVFPDCS